MHWWSKKYFEHIGVTCGGLIEIAENTERLSYQFEAKIKVRKNSIGFLSELLKMTEGGEIFCAQ